MVADSNLMKFDHSSEILRALAHPVRLAIIDLLEQGQALSVSEIHDRLGIEQATASHHLKILRYNNVVNAQRNGRFTCYSLMYDDFKGILKILDRVRGRKDE